MRLTLLDIPHPRCAFAVDEEGMVWLELRAGVWGRGRIDPADGRAVYLRPMWATHWPPLPLERLQAAA